MNQLEQRENEMFVDYCERIISYKDLGTHDLDNNEIWYILFKENLSSDESRKRLYGLKTLIKKLKEDEFQKLSRSQLNTVREKIGELDILKKKISLEKIELNKIKKGFIKSVAIADELKEYLEQNCTIVVPDYCHSSVELDSEYSMIVHVTDWHIGYVIDDCRGNYYNWEIANQRVDKLIRECYKYIEMYNITKIYVIDTGDIVENTYMRQNQSQFCEFNQSEQINKAIELTHKFLVALCKYVDVEYDAIYGNHDRTSGDKKANLDGDNATTIIRDQIAKYKELSKNNRLTVIDRRHTDKEIKKMVNGVKCKFIHGDHSKASGKKLIKDEMSVDNEFYDILFKGHLHNFSIESENRGRYVINTGCLSGFNDYSVNFGCATYASQTIAIIGDGEIELIKDVVLQ